MLARHQQMIRDAAALAIAVADDSGESLVNVLKEMERYIIEETKVGGTAPPGRREYALVGGRILELNRETAGAQ